jgi:hypothetical protein
MLECWDVDMTDGWMIRPAEILVSRAAMEHFTPVE